MLLQVQKPGLTYAASAADWLARFERKPKRRSKASAYSVAIWSSRACLRRDGHRGEGAAARRRLVLRSRPDRRNGDRSVSATDQSRRISFGTISTQETARRAQSGARDERRKPTKAMCTECWSTKITLRRRDLRRWRTNRPISFSDTRAGQSAQRTACGSDPDHRRLELEAESVAFIVCKRNGVTSKSETYLKNFVN